MFKNKKTVLKVAIFCLLGFLVFSMFGVGNIVNAQDTPILPGTTEGENKYNTGSYQLNDLLGIGVKAVFALLSIVGSLALLFFIYGGITLLFSGGSEERVKKGKGILLAAIIGLVIAFSGYLIVDFSMKALGVESDWNVTDWFQPN